MDEKIKNIIDERMEVWGYLKSRYTGKMEEMLVIYQETCKAIISENINTAKDNRMGIIREERKGIPVTPKTVDVPKSEIVEKKTEQKTLGKIENKKEKKDKLTPLVYGRVGEWTPTKNPNIEMKKTSDGGLDFHDIKTGEFWHRIPKNSPK